MLVLVGAGAGALGAGGLVGVALAHGLILVAIIYTFGHISGAHVNPAVTLGLMVGGKINPVKGAIYMVAQFAGAIVAAIVLTIVLPTGTQLGATTPATGVTSIQVLLIEGLLTFFLVSTVYQAAVYEKVGPLAGIAIGFTLAGAILFGGPLTGASLNPARTLGPGLVSGNLPEIVFYLIGIFGGGALAGLLHGFFFRSK
jgi:MIP family channel proteins